MDEDDIIEINSDDNEDDEQDYISNYKES